MSSERFVATEEDLEFAKKALENARTDAEYKKNFECVFSTREEDKFPPDIIKDTSLIHLARKFHEVFFRLEPFRKKTECFNGHDFLMRYFKNSFSCKEELLVHLAHISFFLFHTVFSPELRIQFHYFFDASGFQTRVLSAATYCVCDTFGICDFQFFIKFYRNPIAIEK